MAAVWIVSALVWFLYSGIRGDISVTTTINPVGLLGNNEVELVCTYSLATADTVYIIAWKRETSKNSGIYEQLAGFYPPGPSENPATLNNLTNPSVFGRVVLTNPTDSSLTAKIRFTSVVCGDERKYQCTVLGLNNGAQINLSPASVTSLTVKAKPNATSFNKVEVVPAANVEEGQTVTFTCTGNVGRPAGSFLWTRFSSTTAPTGTPIYSTTQTSPSTDCTYTGSSVISILMTKDDDGIVFKCALHHETISDPTDATYFRLTGVINVFSKPNATAFNEVEVVPSSNVEEGQTVTFTCTGNVGRPAGTFLWTRYKGTTAGTGTPLDSTTQKSPSTDCTYTGSSVISIPMTKDDDGIVVKCALQQETISDPTDTAYFKLSDVINVFYKVRAPTITKSPNAAVHNEDTTLTLTCAAEGNPTPTYVWRHNGRQVGNSAQLQLTNIKIAQSGDYVCEATNNFNGNTYNMTSTVSITIETQHTTIPTTTTTTVPSVNPTSGGCTIKRTIDDGDSTRLYTAGAVMLCISLILLIVTVVIWIFISRNKKLPCFKFSKIEESSHFHGVHHSVSTIHDEDERSRYQQLDSADIAGPSVYQALGQPPNGEQGRLDRNDDMIKDQPAPSLYDEVHGPGDGYTRSYVNMAFSGNTPTVGK